MTQAPREPNNENLLVDVVIPVFGCEETLERLVHDIHLELGGSCNSIILVDDGGPQSTWDAICQLSRRYPVIGVRLTLNCGQHNAIKTGLAASQANYVAVLDCDYQDDPALLPLLIARSEETGRAVIGMRTIRSSGFVDSITSRVFEFGLRLVSGGAVSSAATTFSVLPRRIALRTALKMDNGMHYLHAVAQVESDPVFIPYDRAPRPVGSSSYSLTSRISHAARGLTRWTTRPIYAVLFVGVFLLLLSTLVSLGSLAAWILGSPPPGWTTLILFTNFAFAIQMILLGTLGLYVGALFELASRPNGNNVEEQISGFPDDSPSRSNQGSPWNRRTDLP